jgi:hypothetical protein
MLFPVKECGKGVNKDLLPSELAPGYWSDVLNVEFATGFGRPRRGIQAVFTTPTAIPYFLMTYSKDATTRYLIQAGIAKTFVDDGSTRTEVTHATPPTGGVDDRWTGGVLNGVPFLNNGVDSPMYWDGNTANDFVTLSGWTAGDKVSAMRPFSYFLVGLGYTPSGGTYKPYRVKWSTDAAPGALPTTWTAANTNKAGEVDITEAGPLVDGLALGDSFIIYGKEGRYSMRFIDGNAVFDFQLLPGEDGLLAKGCVVDTPKGHVFFTGKDVMIHQGGAAVSIADGIIRNWLNTSVDSTNASRSFVVSNPQRSEVWVCFPKTGDTSCTRAAAWNWNDGTWTIYSLPNVTYGATGLISSTVAGGAWSSDSASWDSDVTTWDQDEYSSNEARLLLSTTAPYIGLANTGSTDFGTAISAYRERVGIRVSDDSTRYFIRRSEWRFDGVTGSTASIYHGHADTVDTDPTYETAQTYTHGTTKWVNRMNKRALYHAVKVVETGSQPLALRSYVLDLREAGKE